MNIFVNSLDDLAAHVEMPTLEVFRMVRSPESYYKVFRLPKKSGGYRKISAPRDELKTIQKWIATKLLPLNMVHEAATGYRPGMSIVDNAKAHAGKGWVYNVDLEQFFPSIKIERVESLLRTLGLNRRFASEVARLTTLRGELPQGSPSSPLLANLICFKLDERLSALAKKRGWSYTRYCDDITFSGSGSISPRDEQLIRKIIAEEQFVINQSKVRIARRNARQTVTGLVVNQFPNLDRQKRRRIRAMIHRFKMEKAAETQLDSTTYRCEDESRILGHIAYLRMVRGNNNNLILT